MALELIKILFVVFFLLMGVAYFTLFERKVLGSVQRRKGPNVVGFYGLLQPLVDGVKLLLKETLLPGMSNTVIFVFAPVWTFVLAFIGWGVIPFERGVVVFDMSLGTLYLFIVSSLGIYGIMMAGWSSNSKYSFLGGLRATAQMISYEISFGLILIVVVVCSSSFNLTSIVVAQAGVWYIVPLFPVAIMFFISVLAETNRSPFDLPEAEAELVSGYNVEYSAVGFVLFFIAEYLNMMLMSTLAILLFLGGWMSCWGLLAFVCFPGLGLSVKFVFILYLFVWVRAVVPRYRYDQLMFVGWKVLLPFSMGWVLFALGLLL